LTVVLGDIGRYDDHHPSPGGTLLAIEVADSSLGLDLGRQQELYRAAGIREDWVVNLRESAIEVFRCPQGDHWAEHRRHVRGETIRLQLGASAVDLVVNDLLGAAPPPPLPA